MGKQNGCFDDSPVHVDVTSANVMMVLVSTGRARGGRSMQVINSGTFQSPIIETCGL